MTGNQRVNYTNTKDQHNLSSYQKIELVKPK